MFCLLAGALSTSVFSYTGKGVGVTLAPKVFNDWQIYLTTGNSSIKTSLIFHFLSSVSLVLWYLISTPPLPKCIHYSSFAQQIILAILLFGILNSTPSGFLYCLFSPRPNLIFIIPPTPNTHTGLCSRNIDCGLNITEAAVTLQQTY